LGGVGRPRRRRWAGDRRQSLDPRDPPQRQYEDPALQQPHLRFDEGAVLPTSELGKKTKSSPFGTVDLPLNPITLALGADATFVARSIDADPKHMEYILKRAAAHKGCAFIEIYQNCNVFNDGAFEYAAVKETRPDTALFVEHGKQMISGKTRNKGIRLNGLEPEIVELGSGITEDDLLFHDEKMREPTLAMMLGRMCHPEFPEPMGVLRC